MYMERSEEKTTLFSIDLRAAAASDGGTAGGGSAGSAAGGTAGAMPGVGARYPGKCGRGVEPSSENYGKFWIRIVKNHYFLLFQINI